MLLEFHQAINDGINGPGSNGDILTIMGKGLGMEFIVLETVQRYSTPSNIVFLINLREQTRHFIEANLILQPNKIQLATIDNNFSPKERQQIYVGGGCISVTSRILIVDLLNKVIPLDIITGIVITEAHRVSDHSVEAFILRVFRQGNKKGFIKAFSDQPELFGGYMKVGRVMKNLFVKKLALWPRFEELHVIPSLERHKPEIIELHADLTPKMKEIQTAITAVMEACISEVKQTNKIALPESKSQHEMFLQSFDAVLKSELSSSWYKVSNSTKSLLADISTLRRLLGYLTRYDCVTFYSFLTSLNSQFQAKQSVWLCTDEANRLYSVAQSRLYNVHHPPPLPKSRGASNRSNLYPPSRLSITLEENPKWNVIVDVIEEIEKEIKNVKSNKMRHGQNRILIIAHDERACDQLREYLEVGGKKMLQRLFHRYLTNHRKKMEVVQQNMKELDRFEREAVLLNQYFAQIDPQFRKRSASASAPAPAPAPVQKRSLPIASASSSSSKGQSKQRKRKDLETTRKGHKSGKRNSAQQTPTREQKKEDGDDDEEEEHGAIEEQEYEDERKEQSAKLSAEQLEYDEDEEEEDDSLASLLESLTQPLDATSRPESALPGGSDPSSKVQFDSTNELQIMIHPSYSSGEALRAFQPEQVICFDSDLRFFREMEVFASMNPSAPLRVYVLCYNDCFEQHRYNATLNREYEAFKSLIFQKAQMVIPDNQDGKQEDTILKELLSSDPSIIMDVSSINAKTRRGGGTLASAIAPHRVVVDLREFRSSLPSSLHQRGMQILPTHLLVGDYILTPQLCVERKSLQDLIGSLISGRLYNQLTAMCRYYKLPILLIEFDAAANSLVVDSNDLPASTSSSTSSSSSSSSSSKGGNNSGSYGGFRLTSDLPQTLNPAHIISRLCLAILHFPATRLVWSRDATHTAVMFETLKRGSDEPDAAKASAIGAGVVASDSGDLSEYGLQGKGGLFDEEEDMNETPQEILRKLPGITSQNIQKVFDNVRTLADLARMSENEVLHLLGPFNGAKLYNFLHTSPVAEKK